MPSDEDGFSADNNELFANTIRAYLTSPDSDAAARFADAHPELRFPYVIHQLTIGANGAGRDALAQVLHARAALLCGPGWPTGPAVIETLTETQTALASPSLDHATVEQLSQGTRAALQEIHAASPHPGLRPRLLNNFANCLAGLYTVTGDRLLLDEAVQTHRDAVAATPTTSTEHATYLNDLAVHLHDLYTVTDDRSVFDEALQIQRDAVAATPTTSAQRPLHLNNLAVHLGSLYTVTGDRSVLDEAVQVQREAVAATPATSADRPDYLGNLAVHLGDLYAVTGDRSVLDEAVETAREAVDATPTTSTSRPGRLSNLANYLGDLYVVTGDRSLLDEAVETAREAVVATPTTSPDRPSCLNNLASRLGDLYAVTGDRSVLDEALQVQREAVATMHASSPHRPDFLNNLANYLGDLYAVTGDRSVLDEAVETAREAVDATPTTSTSRPGRMNNLANRLGDLYAVTGDRSALDEAVGTAREAVDATPTTSTERPSRLSILANCLRVLYVVSGDRSLLDEAVETAREAVDATPTTSTERPSRLSNLANYLNGLYVVTGDRSLLDEAMSLVEGGVGVGPWQRSVLARTRAAIVRRDDRRGDRFVVAAGELSAALNAFRDELARPGLTPPQRRDLAQRVDGLLGDLTVTHVQAGMVDRALEFIEGDRMWLDAPAKSEAPATEPPVAVAWVMSGQWGTSIITTVDHRDAGQRQHHVLPATQSRIASTIIAALDSARSVPVGSSRSAAGIARARQEAVEQLCRLTGEIAEVFPAVERLLIVPLGVCALLPFTAAARPDGSYLIDHTSLTIAPSLAWARAAHRARPGGLAVGVFHPGRDTHHRLDLGEDRRAFTELIGPPVLGQPSAEQVLALLSDDVSIGHFSCHGFYDATAPWQSSLMLETDLTIQAVLDHTTAPWLVNLSGCETAIPDLQAAEQHISFPTGFLRGGAAHVLATLWPVNNTAATIVNRAFYRQLADGRHPADAFRQAIHQIRGTTPAETASARRPIAAADQSTPLTINNPYWWAPFTHHGSPW